MKKIKFEFSKIIVIITIMLVYPATLYLSWKVLELAEKAIELQFTGALPYLTALVTPAWGAFATILAFYFNKAKNENTAKIKTQGIIKRDY